MMENILHFFAYLSMFPQLVAGPIERAVTIATGLEDRGDNMLHFSAAALDLLKSCIEEQT